MKRVNSEYFRSILFGAQDSLVSTTGIVVGIAAGSQDRSVVVLASFVTIIVEAISMASGQYLSEESIHRLEKKRHTDSSLVGALLMFASYFLSGIIPLAPILLLPLEWSLPATILFALFGLALLGWAKALVSGEKKTRSALQVLIIGGISMLVGLLAGLLLR